MTERRFPPPLPQGSVPPPPVVWRLLLDLWKYVFESAIGIPAPHADTHLVAGADQLRTPGLPTTIEPGDTPSTGDGPSYAREDHRHGMDGALATDTLTTKGDILGFSTVPERVPVSAVPGYALVADPGQALGVKWSPALSEEEVAAVQRIIAPEGGQRYASNRTGRDGPAEERHTSRG